MTEFSDRRPLVFGFVMFGVTEVMSYWIPRTIAFAIGIFIGRLVDWKFLSSKSQEHSEWRWITNTILMVAIGIALVYALRVFFGNRI
jgi:hypothetical protein